MSRKSLQILLKHPGIRIIVQVGLEVLFFSNRGSKVYITQVSVSGLIPTTNLLSPTPVLFDQLYKLCNRTELEATESRPLTVAVALTHLTISADSYTTVVDSL